MKQCENCEKEFPESYIFYPQCGGKFNDKKLGKLESIDESNIMVACVDLHKSYIPVKSLKNKEPTLMLRSL